MFIYSRAAGNKILDDFKKFTYAFSLALQAIYVFYLSYALIVGAGNTAANVILLVLSAAYLIFYTAAHQSKRAVAKEHVRITRHAYNISKLAVKAFTLGVTLYGIHIATSHVSTFSVILAALTVMGWTLGVLFEIVKFVFEKYFDLLLTAIKADVQPYVNFYNKLARKESMEVEIGNDLQDMASEFKKGLSDKKEAKKAADRALKELKKQERIEKLKSLLKPKPRAEKAEAKPSDKTEEAKEETAKK